MSKIYVPLPSRQNLDLYLSQNFDGVMIGIENLSSNFNNYIKIEDLPFYINKIKESGKNVFVMLNRLYFNEEIDNVKKQINEIIKYDIDGIGYTDIGVLNILNELKFNKKVFFLSNHLGTNSKTINFLSKRGVTDTLLSSEITIDEIIKIKSSSNISIGVKLYGFLNMATSSRKLLTNYFEYINKKKNKDMYIMKDKVKKTDYRVVEKFNTDFFTGLVLNGIKYFPKLIDNNIDFIVLDDFMLDELNFYNVIEAYSSLRMAKDDEKFVSTLEKVVESNTYYDTFDGFFNKKTVVKVEDYE